MIEHGMGVRTRPPSADGVLLFALTTTVLIMIGFGSLMYWAMQPTVLPNTGLAEYERQMRKATLLSNAPTTYEAERLAIAAAQRENGETAQLAAPEPQERVATLPPPSKRVATLPRPIERPTARGGPPQAFSNPFGAFHGLFR